MTMTVVVGEGERNAQGAIQEQQAARRAAPAPMDGLEAGACFT
ncbi:MAG: hypothetical protein ACKOZT_08905 [Cyanobium sp.]